ncbi:MAG: type VI secretion system-associated FHA domain protein TagH, partial [Pseudomonas sp.]
PEPQVALGEPPRTAAIPADWDPFADLGISSAPVAPVAPVASVASVAPAVPAVPVAAAQPAPLPEVLPQARPQTLPDTPRVALSEPPHPATASAVLDAFLRGAGMTQLRVGRSEAEAQMEAIGRSYRHMVEGLMEVLRARSSLKGEFRMAQTMIRPVENNPLKFAPNVEEALLLLLRQSNQAFMPPDQAIAESFEDLKAHQLAVMAGVQAAIKHLLKRFEPAVLEARLSKPSGLSGLLPGGRQAQYWELFTELYANISQEAEDDFEDLFGREFSHAYEEHSLKLRKR